MGIDKASFYEASDRFFAENVAFATSLFDSSYADTIETDPVELVEQADKAGGFVEVEGATYFRDPSGATAALSATQLRILAQELDNRNGVGLVVDTPVDPANIGDRVRARFPVGYQTTCRACPRGYDVGLPDCPECGTDNLNYTFEAEEALNG